MCPVNRMPPGLTMRTSPGAHPSNLTEWQLAFLWEEEQTWLQELVSQTTCHSSLCLIRFIRKGPRTHHIFKGRRSRPLSKGGWAEIVGMLYSDTECRPAVCYTHLAMDCLHPFTCMGVHQLLHTLICSQGFRSSSLSFTTSESRIHHLNQLQAHLSCCIWNRFFNLVNLGTETASHSLLPPPTMQWYEKHRSQGPMIAMLSSACCHFSHQVSRSGSVAVMQ